MIGQPVWLIYPSYMQNHISLFNTRYFFQLQEGQEHEKDFLPVLAKRPTPTSKSLIMRQVAIPELAV